MTSVISYANEVNHAARHRFWNISVFLRACNFYCMAKMVFIFHVSYEVCDVKSISGVVLLLSFYPVELLRVKHGLVKMLSLNEITQTAVLLQQKIESTKGKSCFWGFLRALKTFHRVLKQKSYSSTLNQRFVKKWHFSPEGMFDQE